MKVIKPKLTLFAMCVYKMTLNTGYYYYGATTNLGERIYTHLKKFEDNKMPSVIMQAFKNATSVKFEFVRFVNDKRKLKFEEEKYLSRHVGLKKCLNTDAYCTTAFERGKSLFRIARVDENNGILEIYETTAHAAKALGINRLSVINATLIKYPRTNYILRRIDDNGKVIIPIKQYWENPSKKMPVKQYDKKMNFIAEYESYGEAARQTGFDRKGISEAARKKQKTCNGFIFKPA